MSVQFPTQHACSRRPGLRRLLSVAMLAGLTGLASVAHAEDCENPKALKYSIIPTQDTVRELALYKPVLKLLEEETGKKIEFYMPTSYSSVVEALLGKWVDIATLGPESYVIAHGKDPSIEVFATYYKKAHGVQPAGPGYKSTLITKKGSKFDSIESLKGSVLLLVDPASTSGALIPKSLFTKEIKEPLDQYFSRVAFSGGHDLSTIAIENGKADAAFVATHRFMNTVDAGKAKVDDFNYLWTSPRIPQDPFVYRSQLCPDLKAKIKKAFLDLDKTPEGRKYLDNVDSEKFVSMSDSDYDIIREAGVK
ncbi:phosphate/phosphite/phosphonate ABC transporter substrate-binding protein [Allopusillimonas soli]|uniref:Phosphate/phosphite/phosphonate ABC transporter substrate-binding protein n=1 Tax=Allopusillimonas soli TaxID=659016 RepID=A0A853F490_9BURK|nr:phosphate/phosphite/phosphonate ABC transporter substrate-binding protein [Allopusillimonas soli]NYT35314.1 phosphate/phosphite/phosphonate ABC transporter substrate-binding protein [Allopusillimonas soli]TEA75737.1 phosphate/phosphite/phosphonate ABC transporter substrate-binding protein [Allopusillimonas soli]